MIFNTDLYTSLREHMAGKWIYSSLLGIFVYVLSIVLTVVASLCISHILILTVGKLNVYIYSAIFYTSIGIFTGIATCFVVAIPLGNAMHPERSIVSNACSSLQYIPRACAYGIFNTLLSFLPAVIVFIFALLPICPNIFLPIIGVIAQIITYKIYYYYIIVPCIFYEDRSIGFIDALKQSKNVMTGQRLALFLHQLPFVLFLILAVGGCFTLAFNTAGGSQGIHEIIDIYEKKNLAANSDSAKPNKFDEPVDRTFNNAPIPVYDPNTMTREEYIRSIRIYESQNDFNKTANDLNTLDDYINTVNTAERYILTSADVQKLAQGRKAMIIAALAAFLAAFGLMGFIAVETEFYYRFTVGIQEKREDEKDKYKTIAQKSRRAHVTPSKAKSERNLDLPSGTPDTHAQPSATKMAVPLLKKSHATSPSRTDGISSVVKPEKVIGLASTERPANTAPNSDASHASSGTATRAKDRKITFAGSFDFAPSQNAKTSKNAHAAPSSELSYSNQPKVSSADDADPDRYNRKLDFDGSFNFGFTSEEDVKKAFDAHKSDPDASHERSASELSYFFPNLAPQEEQTPQDIAPTPDTTGLDTQQPDVPALQDTHNPVPAPLSPVNSALTRLLSKTPDPEPSSDDHTVPAPVPILTPSITVPQITRPTLSQTDVSAASQTDSTPQDEVSKVHADQATEHDSDAHDDSDTSAAPDALHATLADTPERDSAQSPTSPFESPSFPAATDALPSAHDTFSLDDLDFEFKSTDLDLISSDPFVLDDDPNATSTNDILSNILKS